MRITEALLAEHVVFHHLFNLIESKLPEVTQAETLQSFGDILERLLERHGVLEDRLLVEPLEHCLDSFGHNESFHDEHEKIDAYLQKIRQEEDVDRLKELLKSCVLLSREHFDREERLVFPLADRHLGPATQDELVAEWRKHHDAPLLIKTHLTN